MNTATQSSVHPERDRWLVVHNRELIGIFPSWSRAFRFSRRYVVGSGSWPMVQHHSEYKRGPA